MEINKKIRIAYLGNQISPGGGAMSLYLMVKSVPSDKFDKWVWVSQCRSEEMKKDLSRYCKDVQLISLDEIVSCQTYTTPFYIFIKTLLFSGRKKKQLLKLLVDNQIDILHINNSVFSYINKYIKLNSSVKIVSHVRELINHNGIGFIQRYMICNIMKYSDAIIAISDNEATVFDGHPDLQILPNSFDFSKTANVISTFRKDNGIDNETILIGMLGRFDRFKGHLDFLKALKYLLDKSLTNKKFEFIIIGINPPKKPWKLYIKKMLFVKDYRKKVEQYISDNNLKKHVRLIPFSYHIFSIVKAVDIFVRPSLSGDPWGRDIIEAMAFSKPVVATGTSQFYIKDGITGYLVHPGNNNDLAAKISCLINDEEKRKEFGSNGYKVVNQMCNSTLFSKELIAIYNVFNEKKGYS
jgi:glycosyltransferase involved in cell wall biosynthesis